MGGRYTVDVAVAPAYRVAIGPGLLGAARASFDPARGCAVIADRRVAELYAARLELAAAPLFAIEPGEAAKSFAVLERALEFFAASGLDRASTVVTLGGGVVADLGGLAASLYMRGVAVVHCPTTLLAQVDASVGGKTAVNLAAGKNLAGTFHQPRAVFADTATLATLSDHEFRSGLGELVKTALLDGEELFARVERDAERLLGRDADVLAAAIASAVTHKARIVAADPTEKGERKSLNLGHTFAHAIEHSAGYGRVPHGVAVAAGLGLALDAAAALGLLADAALRPRLTRLLERLGLPASLDALRARGGPTLAPAELAAAMRLDKKGRGGEARFVLPRGLGAVALDVVVPAEVLAAVLAGRDASRSPSAQR